MIRTRIVPISVLLLVAAGVPKAELLEGIAAQVGDELVFVGEVEERAYLSRLPRGAAQGPPTEADRRTALEELINEKILQIYAAEKGIEISDAELEDAVERALANVRSNFASDEEFVGALAAEGLSEAALRQNYEEEIQDKLVRDRVIAAEIYERVEVSRREVQGYYDAHHDELERTERSYRLSRFSIPLPLAEPEAQQARDLLEKLRDTIKGPQEFIDAARAHTEDLGTAERGGDLGWITKGTLVREIDALVQSLDRGQMSDVVRSRFGFHLFFVDERRGEESHLYHILKTTSLDEERAAEIRRAVSEARAELVNGRTDWPGFAARFPGAREQRDADEIAEEELDQSERAALSAMKPGDVSPVQISPIDVSVIKLDGVSGGRVRSLGELYPRIEERLRLEKLDARFVDWIAERRERVFVRVISSSPERFE
ncbi:MAG: hypothetical protein CME06_09000 [Gemmatimonadetes bacterium]|nr:hypothetical protein [Gemmatimonadota bacterium]